MDRLGLIGVGEWNGIPRRWIPDGKWHKLHWTPRYMRYISGHHLVPLFNGTIDDVLIIHLKREQIWVSCFFKFLNP